MNHPHSLPTIPHSPHACSTPGGYTFSVTWTVLRLLTSLALGYSNRLNRKSPGSVVATGFLPGVLSFLCALSHLERIAHRHSFFHRLSNGKNGSGSRLRDRDLTHRLDLGQWMHTDSPDIARAFSDSNRGAIDSFRIDQSFLVQYRGIHGFFQFRRCTRFFCRARVSRTA
jgi:hypothetical protein